MTPAQTTLYFREWNNVRERCKAEGWVLPDRHQLHVRALGKDKSSKLFTNPDLDKVLAVFRSFSQPASVNAQVRQERMPRTRLEHKIKIEQMKLLSIVCSSLRKPRWVDYPADWPVPAEGIEPDMDAAWNYFVRVAAIHGGKNGDLSFVSDQPNPERVDEKSDLECLRDTLDARIGALRRAKIPKGMQGDDAGWSWHDLKTAAGVECDCATHCRKARPTIEKMNGKSLQTATV